jgi:hypothetical protein
MSPPFSFSGQRDKGSTDLLMAMPYHATTVYGSYFTVLLPTPDTHAVDSVYVRVARQLVVGDAAVKDFV